MADKNIPISTIEGAIEKVAAQNPDGKFTIGELLKVINSGKSQTLQGRIERIISSNDLFFSDGNGNFQLKNRFFSNREFLITPDNWEIENGIVCPGHRFTPFINPEIFPSEVTLVDSDGHTIPKKYVSANLSQVYHYHLLLGSEQILDYFFADNPVNRSLYHSAQPNDKVTLHMFDLADFFKKQQFRTGDALLCKVKEYDSGIIEFRYLSGETRQESKLQLYVKAMEEALKIVLNRFDNYLEIPEQLCWAYYLGDSMLAAASDSASSDEFLQRTTEIEISYDQDHSILTQKTDHGDETEIDLPQGVGISRGETSDIAALLHEIGSPLTPIEVDSFILDNCYAHELEFEDFFARTFGREKLSFIDEGQQAVFYNYIEDRFEELIGEYNRYDDEIKAPLRSTIMELVEDRLNFFDFLADENVSLQQLPHEEVHKFEKTIKQINDVLMLLNNPAYTPDDTEIDQLRENIELYADDQDALIDQLTSQATKIDVNE